jgi:hypothetical protein
MGVEHPGGKLAGRVVAEEFDVVGVVADFDEHSAVGSDVDVRGGGGFLFVVVGGVVGFRAGGCEESDCGEDR